MQEDSGQHCCVVEVCAKGCSLFNPYFTVDIILDHVLDPETEETDVDPGAGPDHLADDRDHPDADPDPSLLPDVTTDPPLLNRRESGAGPDPDPAVRRDLCLLLILIPDDDQAAVVETPDQDRDPALIRQSQSGSGRLPAAAVYCNC